MKLSDEFVIGSKMGICRLPGGKQWLECSQLIAVINDVKSKDCTLHKTENSMYTDELSGSIVTQSRLYFGVDEHDDHDLTSRA